MQHYSTGLVCKCESPFLFSALLWEQDCLCWAGWIRAYPVQGNVSASLHFSLRVLRVRLCCTPLCLDHSFHSNPQSRTPTDRAEWPTSCVFSRKSWSRHCGATTLPGHSMSPWMLSGSTYQWVSLLFFITRSLFTRKFCLGVVHHLLAQIGSIA